MINYLLYSFLILYFLSQIKKEKTMVRTATHHHHFPNE